MKKTDTTTAPTFDTQHKDSDISLIQKRKHQEKTVFLSFHEKPKTMLMVAIETGIERANICRYVAHLKKAEKIEVVRKGICPITKHSGVQFLCTVEGWGND